MKKKNNIKRKATNSKKQLLYMMLWRESAPKEKMLRRIIIMTFGIVIVIAWIIAGGLSINEAILTKTYRIAMSNYLICLIMLIFELFCDYILKT